MVFSSNVFLFSFLGLTLLLYFVAPRHLRNAVLLVMSLLFYTWGEGLHVLLMLFSIALNYAGGLLLGRMKGRARFWVMLLAVGANLGLLFCFKYSAFAVQTLNYLPGIQLTVPEIALPIGISFFTFQGMSYVLDVYKGRAEVQRNPLSIALYISLFPQLVAGPIVRYSDISRELVCRDTDTNGMAEGIRRFAIGLTKKAFLANTLGEVADAIFSQTPYAGTQALACCGAVCYAFQIYYDFSGYSDMAIGLGRMFGFHFRENFDHPYAATSMTDFWRRWHMSLSAWFRDYVYIPMGGSRRGSTWLHLIVVFLLTGLWHGAAWHFVAWGLWHGIFICLEKPLIRRGILKKIPAPVRWLYTMTVVLIGWVLFRAPHLDTAWNFLQVMFGLKTVSGIAYSVGWFMNGWRLFALLCAVLAAIPWWQHIPRPGEKTRFLLSRLGTCLLLLFSFMLCMTSSYNPFIYFRF